MLKHNGVSIEDVKLVNVNWALVGSFISKKVDRFQGHIELEVTKLKQKGYESLVFTWKTVCQFMTK